MPQRGLVALLWRRTCLREHTGHKTGLSDRGLKGEHAPLWGFRGHRDEHERAGEARGMQGGETGRESEQVLEQVSQSALRTEPFL